MSGGTPTNFRSGVASFPNYPTPHPEHAFTITRSGNSSDGEAGIAAVPASGGSGQQPSGLSNVARFNSTPSHQGTFPDQALDNPEQYDDTPYIPPRVSQAELQTYPALDPRFTSVYDPTNYDIQHVSFFFFFPFLF